MISTRDAVRAALHAEAERVTPDHLVRATEPLSAALASTATRPAPPIEAPGSGRRHFGNPRGWLVAAAAAVAVASIAIILSLQPFRSAGLPAAGPTPTISGTARGTQLHDTIVGRWAVTTISNRQTGRQTTIPDGSVTLEFKADGEITFGYSGSFLVGTYVADLSDQTLTLRFSSGTAISLGSGDPVTDAFLAAQHALFPITPPSAPNMVSLDGNSLTIVAGDVSVIAGYRGVPTIWTTSPPTTPR